MLVLIIFSLIFGVLTKLADLFNEHGLKEPFKGAASLSGISWGVIGAYLISLNPAVCLFYTGLLLYWILRIKLDYKNHAIGGIIMLLASFMFCSPCHVDDLIKISLVIAAYEGTRTIKDRVKKPLFQKIINFRLYFIPFFCSFLFFDLSVFIASIASIIGIKVTNTLFMRNYDSRSRV